MPGGWHLYFCERSAQYCSASTDPGLSKNVCVPASSINFVPASVASAWNSQHWNPVEGICVPHCVGLPDGSRFVSFCANATCSSQFVGGFCGSSPASRNASLFQ